MSDFKININVGDISVQLEGEGELVQVILNDLRENGLGKLDQVRVLDNNVSMANIDDNPIRINEQQIKTNLVRASEDCEGSVHYPSINDIKLKDLPKTESEWILVYIFYASNNGKASITSDDIKEKYISTNRWNESRRKNFRTNIISCVSNNYISEISDGEYIIKEEGKSKIKEILTREFSNENKGKARKISKSKTPQLLKDLNLASNLERKGLKQFIEETNPKTSINTAAVIIYYLQNIYEYQQDITIDEIYTCWREAGIKLPNNLLGILSHTSSSKYGYIHLNNGAYSMSSKGINFVELTLQGENNK